MTVLDSVRKAHPNLFLMDGGDVGESVSKRRGWLTPVLWETMATLNYDLIAVGKRDLADTSAVWLSQNKAAKPAFITGNIANNDGSPVHQPTQIIEHNGSKIGFVSLISPLFKGYFRNHELLNPDSVLQVAQDIFDKNNVDFRILVYQGNRKSAQEYARSLKNIDLMLLSSSDGREMRVEAEPGQIPMVGPGDRAREVAMISLQKQITGEVVVESTVLPLGNHVASHPGADKLVKHIQSIGHKIAVARQSSRRHKRPARPSGINSSK